MPCVTLTSSCNSPSRHTQKVEESGNRSGVHRSHHLLLGRNHVYMPFFKPSSHFPSPNVPRKDRGNVRQRARRASPSPAKPCQRSIQIQNSLCARWIAYIQTPNSVVKRSIWWSILWNRASRCEEVRGERGGRAGFLHTRLSAKTGTCVRRATHSRAHLREVCLRTFVRDHFSDVVAALRMNSLYAAILMSDLARGKLWLWGTGVNWSWQLKCANLNSAVLGL